jgi:hypothetical protein
MKSYRQMYIALIAMCVFLSLRADANDTRAIPYAGFWGLGDTHLTRAFQPSEVILTVSASYYGQLDTTADKSTTDQQDEEATYPLSPASPTNLEGADVGRRVTRYERDRQDTDDMPVLTSARANRRGTPDNLAGSPLFVTAAPVPKASLPVKLARVQPSADSPRQAMEQGAHIAMQPDSPSESAPIVFLRPSKLSFWQVGILEEEEDTEDRPAYLSAGDGEFILLLPLLFALGFDAFRGGGSPSAPMAPIPEPASVASLLVGIGLLTVARKKGARQPGRLG